MRQRNFISLSEPGHGTSEFNFDQEGSPTFKENK